MTHEFTHEGAKESSVKRRLILPWHVARRNSNQNSGPSVPSFLGSTLRSEAIKPEENKQIVPFIQIVRYFRCRDCQGFVLFVEKVRPWSCVDFRRDRDRERESISPYDAHYSPAVSRCQVQFVRLVEARRNDELRDGWDRERERERLNAPSSDSFLERVDRVPYIGRNVTRQRIGETLETSCVFIISRFFERKKDRRWLCVFSLFNFSIFYSSLILDLIERNNSIYNYLLTN